MPSSFIWPVLAALIYALAAILATRALVEGAGLAPRRRRTRPAVAFDAALLRRWVDPNRVG